MILARFSCKIKKTNALESLRASEMLLDIKDPQY
jgi:hypothetical protein